MEPRICQLEYAAGRARRCPGDTCPFWTDDGCAVSDYWAEFGSNQRLTELLLDIRERLGRDQRPAFRRFHPPGLA